VVLNHESNSEIFLRLHWYIPDPWLRPRLEILKKLQPHQLAISTLSEVFLQNHASSSERLTTQYPKNIIRLLLPQAQLEPTPCKTMVL
jgi:hypothetical protein